MPDFLADKPPASALDSARVWASLSALERKVFRRIVDELGLDSWTDLPPLRRLLPLLANHRLAAEIAGATRDLSLRSAYRLAAVALGACDHDDRDSAHCPGDGAQRAVSRWILAAERRRGQSVRAPSDDAG